MFSFYSTKVKKIPLQAWDLVHMAQGNFNCKII